MGRKAKKKPKSKNKKPVNGGLTKSVSKPCDDCADDGNGGRSPSADASLSGSQLPAGTLPIGPCSDGNDVGRENVLTVKEMERMLLRDLERSYDEALDRIMHMGYEANEAMNSILQNGVCVGEAKDVVMNICNNALSTYNRSNCEDGNDEVVFTDFKNLARHTLEDMISYLQDEPRRCSRFQAVWSLLLSDLHLGQASLVTISELLGNEYRSRSVESDGEKCAVDSSLQPGASHVQTHVLVGDKVQNSTAKDDDEKSVSDSLLQSRASQVQIPGLQCDNDCDRNAEKGSEEYVADLFMQPGDAKVMTEDEKEGLIELLMDEANNLEREVEERKVWAHQKAIQAEEQISHQVEELEMVRMEVEEARRLNKSSLTLGTLERVVWWPRDMRRKKAQMNLAEAAIERLQKENAVLKAEIEAFNLSALESDINALEIGKKEKKNLKRLVATEKQNLKLQEDIVQEKQEITELHQQLVRIQQSQKDAQLRLREAVRLKELAMAQLREEKQAKKATEADCKRRLKLLQAKKAMELKEHKDERQRLEHECSTLEASAERSNLQNPANASASAVMSVEEQASQAEKLVDKECIICTRDEAYVLFLPCAHQIMCADCSDRFKREYEDLCPICEFPILERIRVFVGG